MAHVFVLAEGRELWMDLFLSDLLKRRYPYKMNNGMLGYIQPNPREVKLFDISVPEQCIPSLMSDLASGYANNDTKLRGVAHRISGTIRELAGLHSINTLPPIIELTFWKKVKKLVLMVLGRWEEERIDYQPTHEVRCKWLNIIPMGWKEDHKNPEDTRAMLPYGSELL